MTSDEVVTKLKYHADRLSALLDDPQVGLFTWCQAMAAECQAISDYWAGKWAEGKVETQ